jgi:hypothetical protein
VTNKVYVYDSPTRVRILQVGDDLDQDLLPGSSRVIHPVQRGAEEPEPTN